MKEVVFCLEELSARHFLESLLVRINPENVPIRYIVFEGKQDLEAQLARKMMGYRNPDATFIVMRDQDATPDCSVIKQILRDLCTVGGRHDAVVRIACRELEAFYWGDLLAVEKALEIPGLSRLSNRKQFRNSDSIVNPAAKLRKVTNGLYQKVSGSREIGKHISFEDIGSNSFRILYDSIRKALIA